MASTALVRMQTQSVTPFSDPVYALKLDGSVSKSLFTSTIGVNNAVKFQSNGYSFGWKPDNILYIDNASNMDVIYSVNASASAQYWNNKVIYVGTTQLTSDVFECSNNQLKHTVSLVAPPRLPASYMGTPVSVAIGGVISYDSALSIAADDKVYTSDFTTSSNLLFQDANGNVAYRLPMAFAQDADSKTLDGLYRVTFNSDGTVSFYIMLDWSWLQSAAYPVVIDPTVVSGTTYTTSNTVGQSSTNSLMPQNENITTLSNGWILIVMCDRTASPTCLRVYVSKDNGTTWSQLCYMQRPSGQANINGGQSICSTGTTCHVFTDGGNILSHWTFDATTVTTGSNLYSSMQTIETYTNIGQAPSVIDSNGWIHVATNAQTSSDSYQQLRYGVSKDGGNTWTMQRVTNYSASINALDLTLFQNSPCVFFGYNVASTVGTFFQKYNGTSWLSNDSNGRGILIDSTSGTNFNNNSICADSNNIYVFYCRAPFNSGTSWSIYYSQSTDGGNTWAAPVQIPSTTSSCFASHIIIGPDGKKHLYWEEIVTSISSSYYNIRKVTYDGTNWGTITNLTSNTTNDAYNPQVLTTNPYIYLAYEDYQANAIEFSVTNFNSPPNAPTLNAHSNFDATVAQTFTWTFSDPDAGNTQSAYQLQIVDTGNSTTVVDTGKVGSTTSSYSLNASALTNGHNYQWRVDTWDQNGAQGPYSAYSTFKCSATPTATLTTPTANQSVTQNSITAQGTYSQSGGVVQQSFEFKLWDSAGTTLITDSGTITGTSNMYTFSGLANNTSYKAEFIVTSQDGITASSGKVTFSTSFTPPYAPSVSTTNDAANAKVAVTFTNPAYKTSASAPTFTGTGNGTISQPTTTDGTTTAASWDAACTNATVPATFAVHQGGTQVGTATAGTAFSYNGVSFTITAGATAFAVNDKFSWSTYAYQASSNNVYRRKTGDTTQKLVQQGATSPYNDYTCPAGSYDYGVSAVSSNSVESAITWATIAVSFDGERVVDESNSANNVIFKYNQRKQDRKTEQDFTIVKTFAKYPRVRKGQARYRSGTLSALYIQSDGDVVSQLDKVDAMCNSDNTYLLKSVNGRIYRVVLSNLQDGTRYGGQIGDISVDWTEVGDV